MRGAGNRQAGKYISEQAAEAVGGEADIVGSRIEGENSFRGQVLSFCWGSCGMGHSMPYGLSISLLPGKVSAIFALLNHKSEGVGTHSV